MSFLPRIGLALLFFNLFDSAGPSDCENIAVSADLPPGDGSEATNQTAELSSASSSDSLGSHRLTKERNSPIAGLPYGGIIRTLAGTGIYGFSGDGGPGSSAQVRGPDDVEVDLAGNLYIADLGNERIRMVESFSGVTTCFPHVAVGGGFSTVVTLGNAGSEPLSGSLALWDQQGKPWLVNGSLEDPVSGARALAGQNFPISIPAGGISFLTISPQSPGDPTTSGWAELQSSGGSPYGVATFKCVLSGSLQSVVGVLPSPAMQSATFPVDDDLSLSRFTGYAVANPGVSTIQIELVEVSADGKTASVLDPIVLGPGEQRARFIFQDPKATADFKGTAVLTGKDGAAFTAVALVQVQCATGPVYTVIPVLPAKSPNLPNQ